MIREHPLYTLPDVWLDDTHFVQWIIATPETEPCGGVLYHRRAESPDGWCCGSFFWRRQAHDIITDQGRIPATGDTWQLHSMTPLHLEPSFLCHCGHHGFIRDGAWQAA